MSAAINGVGNVTIEGALDSTASASFILDFYANPACDETNNGEGKTYPGSATVNASAACNRTALSNANWITIIAGNRQGATVFTAVPV